MVAGNTVFKPAIRVVPPASTWLNGASGAQAAATSPTLGIEPGFTLIFGGVVAVGAVATTVLPFGGGGITEGVDDLPEDPQPLRIAALRSATTAPPFVNLLMPAPPCLAASGRGRSSASRAC
jgi:hypothetical protein